MRLGSIGDPGCVGEQLLDGDWTLGRYGLQAGVALSGDGGFGKGRDELTDGLVEADLALLDQCENGCAGNGLGLRGDAEDRVRRHALVRLLVAPSESALVSWLAVAKHQRDGARDPVLVDILLQ